MIQKIGFKSFNRCAPFKPFKSSRRFSFRASDDLNVSNGLNELFLTRFSRPLLLDLFFDLVEFHHIAVLVMQVEEVHLVRQQAAIENALLDDRYVVAEGIAVDAARAHAAASALAADDQTVDAELGQVSNQRRAEESAGALFENDHVARL